MRRFCKYIQLTFILIAIQPVNQPSFANDITILAVGDSLMAGYGLKSDESFPFQLEQALIELGYKSKVINAGVSGDTTAGGLSRIDWLLGGMSRPDIVIVELGANDALRGINPISTRANLAAIIDKSQAAGSRVLLAGMLAPPNLGTEYVKAFNNIFLSLAKEYNTIFYPFFLEGIATHAHLLQLDGLHPTAEGVRRMVKNILPTVILAVNELK